MAAALPLPLPDRPSAQEDELHWYFKESRAEQAGLRSNQGAIERALESGLREPAAGEWVIRLSQVKAIRRAKRIERRLMLVPDTPLTVLCLAHKDEPRLRQIGPRGVLYAHLPCTHAAYKAAGEPLTLLDWLILLADRIQRQALSRGDKRFTRQLRTQAERAYAFAVEAYAQVR